MDQVLAGRYRLAGRLGAGGAGTVWRARDEMLNRDVAVKEVRIPDDLDDASQARFVDTAIHEARAAGRLRDPGIVLVHDVLLEGGRPWIVMDLVTGRSLDQIVRQDGPLPPHTVAAIGLQVLAALEVAHANGILHQDVKPANILLDADGRAMLADFGIAAPMDVVATAGSPGYMAPERLNGLPAGPSSDLWSLGATLYTAVEGVAPFHREVGAAVAAAVLLREPPPPVRAGRDLGRLLLAMLAKDPDDRPAAAAVREALSGARDTAPVAFRRRRSWKIPAALAAVVVVGGGGLAYGFAAPDAARTGRFAVAPDPCTLIGDAQVAQILGAGAKRRTPRQGECQWDTRGRAELTRSITVRVKAHQAQEGHSGPEVASLLLANGRANRDKEETAFRTTTSAVRDVQGVGEQAYAQDRFKLFQGQARTGQLWSSVVLRSSNLTAEVVYYRREGAGAGPAEQGAAVNAAKAVSRALNG